MENRALCTEDADESQSNYLIECIKCFLCDHDFTEGEETWLIFEKHLHCDLSGILASALGREIREDTAHSKLLCDKCNNVLQEYGIIEQRYFEMRLRILTAFNRTAKLNGLATIPIEINGILQEDDALQSDIVSFEDSGENLCQKPLDIYKPIEKKDKFVEQLKMGNELVISADNAIILKSLDDDSMTVPESNICKVEPMTSSVLKSHDFEPTYDVVNSNGGDNRPNTKEIYPEDMMYYDIIELSSAASNDDKVSAESQCCESLSNSGSNNDSSAGEICSKAESGTTTTEEELPLQTKSRKRIVSRKLKDAQPPMYSQHENKYTCALCSVKQEYSPKDFSEHMRLKHNYRFYTCDDCASGFSRRQDLYAHMEKEKHGKFQCETCQHLFQNHRLLRTHKRVHYANAKQYECSECHKKYTSKILLDGHMNMHAGLRPFKCTKCPKTFASKYTLQAHSKIHSDRERPFQCDQCDKAFLNQQNLTQHRKLHSGVKSFVCEICSKAFGTQHNLYVHQVVHSGIKPYICRTCGKAFARRAEIKDHERIHTGERPFKCDLCHMAFAQRSNLTSHKKSTHFNEKLHTCKYCNRSFKRRRLLDYHTQSAHTGERPHKCEVCNASFVYPEHHKKHMLIHLGVKPYACEVCGKHFNSRDNRNAHRFIHSNKKPYECLECGAGFMRKPLLLAHMRHKNHSHDTIIVNQPQIGACSEVEDEDLALEGSAKEVTGPVQLEYKTEDELDNETDKSYVHLVQGAEGLLAVTDNNCDDSSDIIRVGQLIKDEVGDVKYLQFEDVDGDGHQTLTWVDIANRDS